MKKISNMWLYPLVVLGFIFVSFASCKTEVESKLLPILSTDTISAVTQNTAVCGGNITSDNGLEVTARGVCWSLKPNPTTNDTISKDAAGTGKFKSQLTNLLPDTVYYVRAYATNNDGTAYGLQVTFRTLKTVFPVLTTTKSTEISDISATSGGNVSFNGGTVVTGRGVCWSTNPLPTILDNKTTNGNGNGIFTSSITGLTAGTTYYIRAYATNNAGTGYGNQDTIKTLTIPTLTTISAVATSATTASSGGNVSNDGGTPVTNRGICWSTTSNPTINDSKTNDGNGTGNFTSTLSSLTANVTYYIRAYATNKIGTAYGNVVTVKTSNFPTNGLVAWYPFNGNANDESGNGNNGTNYGATLTSDRFGNSNSAYNFKNSYIKCTNTNIPTNSFTLSAWVYENTSFADNEFICLGSASSTKWGAICSPLHTTLNYGRGCGASGGNTISPTIPLKSWQHIVFVSQGKSLSCDIYINGVLIGTTKNNDEGSCTTNNLYFGVDIFSAPEYIDGALDDIGIWNRALTQEEITNLYNQQQ